jgi:type I restriction enzyme S subunit
LQIGDILIEISGGGPDQPVGRILYIDESALSVNSEVPKICSNFLRSIRLKPNVNKHFVSLYLQHFYKVGNIKDYQAGSNNLRNLKFKDYSSIPIPIPDLKVQNAISIRLDYINRKVHLLKTRLANLPLIFKVIRQKILYNAMTGEMTAKWRRDHGLSFDWQAVKIGDLISGIEAGKNFSCPNIPVAFDSVGLVKISAVTWGKFDARETKTVTDARLVVPKLFIKEGDFLFSRANTLELVGASVIVDKIDHKIMLSDKIWRVYFKSEITKHYVNQFLKSTLGRTEIEARASGNQLSMRNISQDKFKDINIILPPENEQEEIVRQLDRRLLTIERMENIHRKLTGSVNNISTSASIECFGETTPD